MHPLRKHLEEIISLNDEEFDFILSHFSLIKKRKHQFIVQEGDMVDKIYWVIKGCLRTCFYDDTGKEHILQFAMENWWASDYDSFVYKTKAKTSIDCLEDCELLYITSENREKLTSEMHKMETFWAKKTVKGRISLQNRVLSLLKNSAKERYELFLSQYPQLFQRVSKKMISAYLGVSRETLSRLNS
ncbi:MAG: Crp/Fnr family transcriptional regulator [Flavobacteriaceae bacterium]|nr:Crp/Fnr family transcriptional regulator [Flavobacteriaceae bacterium]